MISFVDNPFVITIEGIESADGEDIWLLGVEGSESNKGLILASGVLEWYPLDEIKVVTSMTFYERVEPEETPEP